MLRYVIDVKHQFFNQFVSDYINSHSCYFPLRICKRNVLLYCKLEGARSNLNGEKLLPSQIHEANFDIVIFVLFCFVLFFKLSNASQ